MLTMILACDLNGGIGQDGKLPWPRIDRDMKWLKQHVEGKTLVMGRSTYDTLPKIVRSGKLYNNKIVLITNRPVDSDNENLTVMSVDKDNNNVDVIAKMDDVVIFGGAKIYELFLDRVDRLVVTVVQNKYKCDTKVDRDFLNETFKYCGFRDDDSEDAVFEILYRNVSDVSDEDYQF